MCTPNTKHHRPNTNQTHQSINVKSKREMLNMWKINISLKPISFDRCTGFMVGLCVVELKISFNIMLALFVVVRVALSVIVVQSIV